MARRVRSQFRLDEEGVSLSLSYPCPACGQPVQCGVEGHDVYANVDPCEMCGDHGYIEVEGRCSCGHAISVMVREW